MTEKDIMAIRNEEFNRAMSAWVTPILLGIVGYFVVGIVNDVKEIKSNQMVLIKEQAQLMLEITHIKEEQSWLEERLDKIEDTIQKHLIGGDDGEPPAPARKRKNTNQ